MPLRNARPLTLKPQTVTDAVDGTNAPAGSMMAMQNLVPSMHTRGVWVPRPAAYKLFDLLHVTLPEGMVEIGNRLYGIGVSNRFSGQSEPFIYDLAARHEVPIAGVMPTNLPLNAPSQGDWQPPTIARVGAYVLFSHPGFSMPNAFGWIDITGFSDQTTGDVGPGSAGGIVVSNLGKNVLNAGWRPGMVIRDSAGLIPPDTRIAAVAADGLLLTLTRSTTGAMTGDILQVLGGTPGNPLWAAGNLSPNSAGAGMLPAPAAAISLFNGRAEYAVNTQQTPTMAETSAVIFSAAGDPLIAPPSTIDNVVTLQNGITITALTTQPFNNSTVAGGIVNALLVWQGDSAIWQITGDPATSNLALNYLSDIGSDAPLTIQTSPDGTLYIAPDGMRMIQLNGTVSEPLSANGDGVAQPFINAQFPSRMAAAYNEDVYRVTVPMSFGQTGGISTPGGGGVESPGGGGIDTPGGGGDMTIGFEYWYHIKLRAWSGPHTSPARLITPSDRPGTNHGYLIWPLKPATIPPGGIWGTDRWGSMLWGDGDTPASGVWFSNSRPVSDSSYVENGTPLTWTYQPTLFPDNTVMFQNMMVESTLALSLAPADSANVSFFNEVGEQIDAVTINGFTPANAPTPVPPGIWGQGKWGTMVWGAGTSPPLFTQRRLPWHQPLVFKQATMQVTGTSDPAVAIGNLYLRYQVLGYMIEDPSISVPPQPANPPLLSFPGAFVGAPGPPGGPGPPGPPGPPGGAGTIVYQNFGAPFVLPAHPSLNTIVTVVDNTGTPGTVISTSDGSLINGLPTFADYLQPFASFGFVWNGSGWRVL